MIRQAALDASARPDRRRGSDWLDRQNPAGQRVNQR